MAEINDPSRLQEYIIRAFRMAMSGRPGLIVLALPEDMLYDHIKAPPRPRLVEKPRFGANTEHLDALKSALAGQKTHSSLLAALAGTQNPLLQLQIFAEKQNLPVAASFAAQRCSVTAPPLYRPF